MVSAHSGPASGAVVPCSMTPARNTVSAPAFARSLIRRAASAAVGGPPRTLAQNSAVMPAWVMRKDSYEASTAAATAAEPFCHQRLMMRICLRLNVSGQAKTGGWR